jgi:tetratricopeptide (TPR) repeat protein
MRIALEHLDLAADPERGAAIRVRLAGTMYSSGDEDGAVAEAQRACDLLADRGPSQAKVRALSELASLHLRIVQQDPRPAIDAAREAVAVAAAIGDRYAQSHALRTLGTALCWAGDVEEGIGQLREALALSSAIANPTAILGVYMRLYISLVDFARDDEEAASVADEALAWLETEGGRWGQATNLLMWFAYGFMRGGQWQRAEEMLDQSATYHIEGMSAMSYHSLRGILRWMQGRLTEAQTEMRLLRATDPRPRYFRLLYPVEAEIAADEGRLADVRRLAAEHLAAEVIPAEEATKAGTLRALVRAEMDAAETDAAAAADHVARAENATGEIRRVVAGRLTEPLSGLQLEPPAISLTLAEAELTRGTDAAPAAWSAAREGPLFAFWRAYATWRLGESLVAAGHREEGLSELRSARRLATALGATLLRARIDALVRRLRLSL